MDDNKRRSRRRKTFVEQLTFSKGVKKTLSLLIVTIMMLTSVDYGGVITAMAADTTLASYTQRDGSTYVNEYSIATGNENTGADAKTSIPGVDDLEDGQVWTDKSVEYNNDGSFDITLSALGKKISNVTSTEVTEGSSKANIIFVLDVSKSMFDKSDNRGKRIDTLVSAANSAIKEAVANGANVGVVGFSSKAGDSYSSVHANVIIPLGTKISEGQNALSKENNNSLKSPITGKSIKYGGTNPQSGLMLAYQELFKYTQEDKSEITPVIILMTDGVANRYTEKYSSINTSISSLTWSGSDSASSDTSSTCNDAAYYTILTANEIKKALNDPAKGKYTQSAKIYTAGFGVDDSTIIAKSLLYPVQEVLSLQVSDGKETIYSEEQNPGSGWEWKSHNSRRHSYDIMRNGKYGHWEKEVEKFKNTMLYDKVLSFYNPYNNELNYTDKYFETSGSLSLDDIFDEIINIVNQKTIIHPLKADSELTITDTLGENFLIDNSNGTYTVEVNLYNESIPITLTANGPGGKYSGSGKQGKIKVNYVPATGKIEFVVAASLVPAYDIAENANNSNIKPVQISYNVKLDQRVVNDTKYMTNDSASSVFYPSEANNYYYKRETTEKIEGVGINWNNNSSNPNAFQINQITVEGLTYKFNDSSAESTVTIDGVTYASKEVKQLPQTNMESVVGYTRLVKQEGSKKYYHALIVITYKDGTIRTYDTEDNAVVDGFGGNGSYTVTKIVVSKNPTPDHGLDIGKGTVTSEHTNNGWITLRSAKLNIEKKVYYPNSNKIDTNITKEFKFHLVADGNKYVAENSRGYYLISGANNAKEFSIQVTNGQSDVLQLEKLPYALYTIEELDATAYSVTTDPANGIYPSITGTTSTLTIKNTEKEGVLQVVKKLGADTLAEDKDTFTLTITGDFTDGSRNRVVVFGGNSGNEIGTPVNVPNVIAGRSYEVAETETNTGDRYIAVAGGAKTAIAAGTTASIPVLEVTNTAHKDKTQVVKGMKIWADTDNDPTTAPPTMGEREWKNNLILKADGVVVTNPNVTVTPVAQPDENGFIHWNFEFKNLDKYNAYGKVIEYTVEENSLDGYVTTLGETNTITNIYQTTELELTATKTLTGHSFEGAPTFNFVVRDKDGKIVTNGTNVNGTITFNPIGYDYKDIGEHIYTISEQSENPQSGFIYSDTVYTIKVIVGKAADGTLTIDVKRQSGKNWVDYHAEDIVFANSYAADGSWTPEAIKTLNSDSNRELEEGQFTFNLSGNGQNQEKSNTADGKVIFDEIKYTAKDIGKEYTYTITEVNDGKAGYTYDNAIYTITVKITDNGDGTLNISKSYKKNGIGIGGDASISFTNQYKAVPAYLDLMAKKILDGRTLTAGQFKFTLTGDDGTNQEKSNGIDGTVAFDRITYNLSDLGEYTYTIKEEIPDSPQGGYTYDDVTYTVNVKVTDDGNGKVKAEATYTKNSDSAVAVDSDQIIFTNKYALTANGQLKLTAKKTINNAAPGESRPVFQFKLEGYGLNQPIIKTNNADGNISFDTIQYTLDDVGKEIVYTITEVNDGKPGYTYDNTQYQVKVSVEDKNDGTLSVVPSYYKNGDELPNGTVDDIKFNNVYKATSAGLPIMAKKVLEGENKALEAGAFEFLLEVWDSGKYLERGRAKNQADGTVNFGTIPFDQYDINTTYRFTISEIAGTKDGYTYSQDVYSLEVKVSDNGDGTLNLATTYFDPEGDVIENATGEDIIFTNQYAAEDAGIKLTANKTLHGRELKANDFSFTLSGNGINDVQYNAADGSVAFDEITYTQKDMGKTYTYNVKENIPANIPQGYQYDTTEYKVTVYVRDNDNGTMTPVVTYHNGSQNTNGISFTNTYTAEDTTAVLQATKKLSGRTIENGQFQFTLTGPKITESQTVSNIGETVTFNSITFTQDDIGKTFWYTMKEVVPNPAEPGYQYDETTYMAKVEVKDNGNGTLNAVVTYTDEEGKPLTNNSITFRNNYTVSDATATFKATKTLEGRALTAGQFSFQLLDESGKVLQTVENIATTDYNVSFAPITYKQADLGKIYKYSIKEVIGTAKGYTYDNTVYQVTVEVRDKGNGTIEPIITYLKNDVPTNPVFANKYKADDTSVAITGKKTLTGRVLGDKQFEFQLKDSEGNVLQTVTNSSTGDFAFTEIPYTYEDAGKEFTYSVSEKPYDAHNGYTTDATIYTVTVKVIDDGTGQLSTEVSYMADEEEASEITFENNYTIAAETKVNLEATKTLAGRTLTANQFQFTLSDENGVIETVGNDTDGNVIFTELAYGQNDLALAAEKEFTYWIKEVIPETPVKGYTYDSNVYKVVVKISDTGEGTLAKSVTYFNATENQQIGAEDVKFANAYKTADADLTLEATKTLVGRTLEAGKFEFTLIGGNENQTVKNSGDDGATVTFNPITFTHDDIGKTYQYTISEVNEKLDGYVYDNTVYTATVTIGDDGNGNLTIDTVYKNGAETVDSMTFKNTYTAESQGIAFVAAKTLEGRELTEEQFSFQLNKIEIVDDNPVATTLQTKTNAKEAGQNVGTVTFDPILYTHEDIGKEFVYTINEVEAGEPGYTYDAAVYTVKVNVSDTGYGKLNVEVKYFDESGEIAEANLPVTFANKYQTGTTSVNLTANKTLEGRGLTEGQFNFRLTDITDSSKTEVVEEVANTAGGTISFASLTFKQTDIDKTFIYQIEEVDETSTKPGYTFDDRKYTVEITVRDNGDGTLSTEVVRKVNGDTMDTDAPIIFANSYTTDNAELTLGAKKVLEGWDLAENQFNFALTGDKDVNQTVTNDSEGNISFAPLTFEFADAGKTFNYTISEVAGSEGGYTYDATQYTVTVKVEDNNDGTLALTTTYKKGTTVINANDILFRNRYEAEGSEPLTISAAKEVTGDKSLENEVFHFIIKEGDKIVANGKNDESGLITFNKDFTYYKPGIYEYKISEVNDNVEGYTYSDDIYTVTVEVSDSGTGKLVAEIVNIDSLSGSNDEIVFTNEYTTPVNDLIVEKHVLGNSDEEFLFQITVNGDLFNGHYTLNNDKDTLYDITDGQFTLRDGDKAFIKDIERDAEYEVQEIDSRDHAVLANGKADNTVTGTMISEREGTPKAEFTNIPKDKLVISKTRIGGNSNDVFTFKLRYSRANASDATPGDSDDVGTASNSKSSGKRKNFKTLMDDIFDSDGDLAAFKGSYSLFAKDEDGNLVRIGNRTASDGEIKLRGGEFAVISGFVADTYYEVEEILPEDSKYRVSGDSDNVLTGTIATGSNAEIEGISDFANLADFVNVFKYSEIRTRYYLRNIKSDGTYKDHAEGSRPNSGYDKFEVAGDLSQVERDYLDDMFRVDGKDYNYDLVNVTVNKVTANNTEEILYSDTSTSISSALSDFDLKTLDEDAVYRITVDFYRVKGSVVLNKIGMNGQPLQGAKFQLYNENGDPVGDIRTTKEDGTITVENLLPGSYYFVEKEAPAGYVKDTTPQEFELVSENNYMDVVEIAMENEVGTGSVVLKKSDENGSGLSGVEFNLYMANGNLIGNYTTDVNGEIRVENLAMGSYYFVEETALAGYIKDTTPIYFDISFEDIAASRSVTTEPFINSYEEDGKIVLTKTDGNGAALANAVFDLYRVGTDSAIRTGLVTDSEGKLTVEDLAIGTYYFVETKAPDGFVTPTGDAARSSQVEINFADHIRDNKEATITITNDRQTGSVKLTKTNANGSTVLAGAEFSLYTEDGTLVKSGLVTNAEGIITYDNLPIGTYYFQETKAPSGYRLPTGTAARTEFTVEYGKTAEVTVSNTRSGGTSGGGGGGGGSRTPGNSSGGPGAEIPDNPVPLANLPGSDSGIVINDGLVPLANLPKTGDSPFRSLMTLFSGLMLGLAALFSRKKKEDEQ